MDDANDLLEVEGGAWTGLPTSKQRFGAQHAVARLLDELAPERPPARREEPLATLQRVRSPRGCILQATQRAVTVSWFPSGATDPTLGELQVTMWEGTVSRPGSAQRAAGGARAMAEETLVPIEVPEQGWAWRTADGRVLDARALAARCQQLLIDEETAATRAQASTAS